MDGQYIMSSTTSTIRRQAARVNPAETCLAKGGCQKLSRVEEAEHAIGNDARVCSHPTPSWAGR